MKLHVVYLPLMGLLLHLVQRGGHWGWLQPYIISLSCRWTKVADDINFWKALISVCTESRGEYIADYRFLYVTLNVRTRVKLS